MIPAILLTLFFSVTTLQAQFSAFAPTADGASLYFSTYYVQKNTGQPDWGKIFVVDEQGLRPYAILPREAAEPGFTNFHALSAPSVSSDGKVIAYAGTRDCLAGRQCFDAQFTQTTITGLPGKGDVTLNGRAYVSRNGRFAHVYETNSLDSSSAGIWDLQTGTQLLQSPYIRGNPQSIADDGTAVFANSGLAFYLNGQLESLPLGLYRNGHLGYQPLGETCESAVIDRAGTAIVITSRWWEPNAAYSRLRILDLGTRRLRTLAEGAGDVSQPTISDDGRHVLFLSTARFSGPATYGPAQAFLVAVDGSAARQITSDPAGIQSAALSGNGRVAFVFTYGGRLLRVNLDAADETTELIPRTPFCCSGLAAAAGSLYTMTGTGLYDSGGNPPALSFNGGAIPLVSSSPSQLTFLVPWELADQTATMSVGLTSDSSFEIPATATQTGFHPVARNPQFFSIPPQEGTQGGYGIPFGKAAHQNFEGLITQDSPARRGETVHLYATGLGPVDAAGRATQPFTCSIPTRYRYPIRDGYVDAPVVFAGLAPGIAGVYQVDLRIPPVPSTDLQFPTVIQIACGNSTPGGSATLTALPLARD